MVKMRWKNIISRSQIDRKKFVFNVIRGEERGSSGLLGWLRDREKPWNENEERKGRGEKMRKDFIVVCICTFWDFVVIWIYQVFALSFLMCCVLKGENRREDAKKENFNGAVEWEKQKNQFHKEALRCVFFHSRFFFSLDFFSWGFYVKNVINCVL